MSRGAAARGRWCGHAAAGGHARERSWTTCAGLRPGDAGGDARVTRIAGWALVAVAARLAMSWASAESGVFADMAQYHERAVHLATTGTLFPDALRGPGYPALLALVYRLGGVSFWGARVANAFVGGALAGVTGLLARRAGAGERAWIASAVVALYPGLVLSSVYLMPEGLYTLLATLALLVVRHRSVPLAAAAGVVTGIAILTRSVGVALLVVCVAVSAWMWLTDVATAKRALARVAVFTGTCLLVLAPWLAFTTRVAGGPLLDATSGMNVLLGNHDTATGRLNMADDAPLRQQHVVGATSEADANARALSAGVAWAVAHPGAWLRLAGAKVSWLLGLEGREHAWGYSVGYFGPRGPLTVTLWGVLLMAAFPLLVGAAALGLARARGRLEAVHIALGTFVVATIALHVASFGESRFHLPLLPVFAVAAALGATPLATASRLRLVAAGAV